MPTYNIEEKAARAFEAAGKAAPVSFYDASKEVRQKGVGFYNFSLDKAEREAQLEAFKTQHKVTVDARSKSKSAAQQRREQLEQRRIELAAKRDQGAQKMGERWLSSMGYDL